MYGKRRGVPRLRLDAAVLQCISELKFEAALEILRFFCPEILKNRHIECILGLCELTHALLDVVSIGSDPESREISEVQRAAISRALSLAKKVAPIAEVAYPSAFSQLKTLLSSLVFPFHEEFEKEPFKTFSDATKIAREVAWLVRDTFAIRDLPFILICKQLVLIYLAKCRQGSDAKVKVPDSVAAECKVWAGDDIPLRLASGITGGGFSTLDVSKLRVELNIDEDSALSYLTRNFGEIPCAAVLDEAYFQALQSIPSRELIRWGLEMACEYAAYNGLSVPSCTVPESLSGDTVQFLIECPRGGGGGGVKYYPFSKDCTILSAVRGDLRDLGGRDPEMSPPLKCARVEKDGRSPILAFPEEPYSTESAARLEKTYKYAEMYESLSAMVHASDAGKLKDALNVQFPGLLKDEPALAFKFELLHILKWSRIEGSVSTEVLKSLRTDLAPLAGNDVESQSQLKACIAHVLGLNSATPSSISDIQASTEIHLKRALRCRMGVEIPGLISVFEIMHAVYEKHCYQLKRWFPQVKTDSFLANTLLHLNRVCVAGNHTPSAQNTKDTSEPILCLDESQPELRSSSSGSDYELSDNDDDEEERDGFPEEWISMTMEFGGVPRARAIEMLDRYGDPETALAQLFP